MMRWVVPTVLIAVNLFLPGNSQAAAPERLRVVTYNVHWGKALKAERDGDKDESIARALDKQPKLAQADILALQEVCAGEGGWQVTYFENYMRERGAAYTALAYQDPTLTDKDETVGHPCDRAQVLVSRYPIVASGTLSFPPVRQPRSAVWADILVPSADGNGQVLMRVYNAHLENRVKKGSSEEGRMFQMQVLLEHLEAWRREHPGAPAIVLGDLNSTGRLWNPWYREQALRAVESHGFQATMSRFARTLTWLPYQVDWIFSSGLTLKSSDVVHICQSDHFPVVADFAPPNSQ